MGIKKVNQETNAADFLKILNSNDGNVMFIDTESTTKYLTLRPIIYDFGYSIYSIDVLNNMGNLNITPKKNTGVVTVSGGEHHRYLVQEMLINKKLLEKIMSQRNKMEVVDNEGKLYYQALKDLWGNDSIETDPVINVLEDDIYNQLYDLVFGDRKDYKQRVLDRYSKAKKQATSKIRMHQRAAAQDPAGSKKSMQRQLWIDTWQHRERKFEDLYIKTSNEEIKNEREVIIHLVDTDIAVRNAYIELLYDKTTHINLDRIMQKKMKSKYPNIKLWRDIISEVNLVLKTRNIIAVGGHNWQSADLTFIENTSRRLGQPDVRLNLENVARICTQNLMRAVQKADRAAFNSLLKEALGSDLADKQINKLIKGFSLEQSARVVLKNSEIIEKHVPTPDIELNAALFMAIKAMLDKEFNKK